MVQIKRWMLCLSIIILGLFVEEALSRGGRGGGGRGGSRGGGRSISGGGGYGGVGSSGNGGGDSGSTVGITFGVIGGSVAFSALICLCVKCLQGCSGSDKTNGIVYNTPGGNRTRTQNGSELEYLPHPYSPPGPPPAYSAKVTNPIYNVQDEIETTQYHGHLRQSKSAQSAPKVHKPSSKNQLGPL